MESVLGNLRFRYSLLILQGYFLISLNTKLTILIISIVVFSQFLSCEVFCELAICQIH